jgi:hypothetical protein
MPELDYIRLTRSRRRLIGGLISVGSSNTSLWLGPDHVLVIDKTSYADDYKRFYFSDIQAFIIRRTDRRLITSLCIGLPLAAFALIAFLIDGLGGDLYNGGGIFFGLLALVLAVLLTCNLAAGPTVQTYVQTAVQVEELPPLNRLGRAYKVLDRLRPLVVAAQGQLTPAEIPERMRAAQAAEAAAAPPPNHEAPPVIES